MSVRLVNYVTNYVTLPAELKRQCPMYIAALAAARFSNQISGHLI